MTVTWEMVVKNVDARNATSAAALVQMITAAANERPHLRGSIRGFQWGDEGGIGILVEDAGHRMHLANAIGLPRALTEVTVPLIGKGVAREGNWGGFHVRIWNLEQ